MTTHGFIETNGIRLHVVEAGEGPLVLLLHGFPELWYSWRHQIPALAAAGYHVVAPDQRGFGRSDRPGSVDDYTMLHLVGDVVGLVHAFGEERATVVGHDFGAPVAWQTALLRPDVVRGVVTLSAPPRYRPPTPPLRTMRELLGGEFYVNRLEEPEADAEFDRDPRTTFRRLLFTLSGDNPANDPTPIQLVVPRDTAILDYLDEPAELPSWLDETELDVFADTFAESGFTSALDWYRALDRGWELTGAWAGATVRAPALFVGGDRDPSQVMPGAQELISALTIPKVILPGAGHWIQQERPDEITGLLLDFLAEHGRTAP
ncbi:alpha/beta fold hydrolase [Umezawaea tangerina]|uniref:Pimeloyl-ACP methyl ester carboxylesterase n=1 Tax=Umezawaea tangerina TaxID=84725 RepID=A0A2T0T1A0_9PSEU|nr:alpha/beta hydrolase [Umezawaea tangerina]PRY39442.1 pimeloyl-ACP methyl ester carboxylesterase [Umezawaea tangerina]